MASNDPFIRDHQAWLGYLQPDGLVVSPAALAHAQANLNRNTLPLQERFLPFVHEIKQDDDDPVVAVTEFTDFVCRFLEWPLDCLVGATPDKPLPDTLKVPLRELGETLEPSFALRVREPKGDSNDWILLVKTLPLGTDFDARMADDERSWSASRHQRFERLLRETKVPIGLLSNGTQIRLIYAPDKENSGSLTFPVKAMTEVAGRPILAGLDLLLNRYRLFAAPTEARLLALLQLSREFQSSVSTKLAQQVLDALYELLRGFQTADKSARGEILREVLAREPDDVYGGLLTVLLRLVFLLFAEDRGVTPTNPKTKRATGLYVRNYSVHGLFERLKNDAEHYPDTMDHRYGAWAQLLALFRVIHKGSKHPQMNLPARSGHLFDPDRFPFLEGRVAATQNSQISNLPLVSDGVIYRVLENLLILDSERLSYRTLDVEQIGSVYQTVMGFRLEIAEGPSIAIVGKRKGKGAVPAPIVINLDTLLSVQTKDRSKWLREHTDQELSGEAQKTLKSAANLDDLLAALDRKIARNATPDRLPKGSMILQPTDERRRSGSHYTPRKFTEPIVRKTLEPILKRLGEHPTPEQILFLKICDVAVGSGAFLVETCRQLGDELAKAWHRHGGRPPLPEDETEELLAMRLIAQRCLYGVDRNPMAVDLAKLSLWLVTLAKDHPFTFLDHAIRCGDSLVGLTRRQIAEFHWKSPDHKVQLLSFVEGPLKEATRLRQEILAAGDLVDPLLKSEKLELADKQLEPVRFVGDLIIAAFFGADNDKRRRQLCDGYAQRLSAFLKHRDPNLRPTQEVTLLRNGQFPVRPFHWEVEFPEVFDRENPGFDAIAGNPPFLGGTRISAVAGMDYFQWLGMMFPHCEHLCDLVAYFFRRVFAFLREGGAFGLIATNTVSQGDTREGGLRIILREGGQIYYANRRHTWPSAVAVVVSVIHVAKHSPKILPILDGKPANRISAYLVDGQMDDSPVRLASNPYFSLGSKIYGQGFLFDDNDVKCTPIAERQRLIASNPSLESRIPPYIGGEELLTDPRQQFNRYVIALSDIETETGLNQWPELRDIVRTKVKPERDILGDNPNNIPLKKKWWAYQAHRPGLYSRLASMKRVMASSQVAAQFAFTMLPTNWVYSQKAILFCIDSFSGFATVQSRVHEFWARFFSATAIELLCYTPSDCFETFPFPAGFEMNTTLEQAGQKYYEFRAALMVRNNEGLTTTYNRFHDPEERSADILKLRELHTAMDRAVLDAYGWENIPTDCRFLLDHEDEDDEESTSKKRKPWRYRWPDDIRDEVLARLLKLNAERAEEERLAALAAAGGRTVTKTKSGRKHKTPEGQGELI